MASQAFRIVRGRVCREWLMRIVAGSANQTLVAGAPTLAIHQAIGLHADVGDSGGPREFDVHPRAVARAAKIDAVTRAEAAGIENKFTSFFVAVTIVRLVELHR